MKNRFSIAESDYETQFLAIRNDSVVKTLYRALAESIIKEDWKLKYEIEKIIQRELKINYSKLLKPKLHEYGTAELANVDGNYVPEIYSVSKRSYVKDFAKTAIENYFARHPDRIAKRKR